MTEIQQLCLESKDIAAKKIHPKEVQEGQRITPSSAGHIYPYIFGHTIL
jgi:hypothetical protein